MAGIEGRCSCQRRLRPVIFWRRWPRLVLRRSAWWATEREDFTCVGAGGGTVRRWICRHRCGWLLIGLLHLLLVVQLLLVVVECGARLLWRLLVLAG